jgi:RNA:NAD 2'-phosphotransferase (TPT1/KptA family)
MLTDRRRTALRDQNQAQKVGRRHDADPIVLTVSAREASQQGVVFLFPGGGLYRSPAVPPEFIEIPLDTLMSLILTFFSPVNFGLLLKL